MHILYPIVLNLKQSLQRVQNDWFCAKVISFNTKRCCCGPLNAACSYISSPFSHLRPKIFTEKEDVFSNIWNMRFMTHKKEKERTSSFNFCDGSSAVICLRLYCQWSSVGNFYRRHAFFFFFFKYLTENSRISNIQSVRLLGFTTATSNLWTPLFLQMWMTVS